LVRWRQWVRRVYEGRRVYEVWKVYEERRV